MAKSVFYPRYAEPLLAEALEDSPVVLIHGPRQCGKTTLAQFVCAPKHFRIPGMKALKQEGRTLRDYNYVSFDDEVARAGAEADPMGFVADLPERVIIDEVQRSPGIFAALKLEVDRRREPGRFVLTGSTNVLRMPTIADSLAGRLQVVPLQPLAQCEIESSIPVQTIGQSPRPDLGQEFSREMGTGTGFTADRVPGFLDELFAARFRTLQRQRLGHQLSERIVSGGYPAALARPPGRRRANWYRNYLDAQMQRDVPGISRIRSIDLLPRLLSLAAAQTARLFNLSSLAAPFQVSRPTIRDYVTLLGQAFLLEHLPPWHSNRISRLVKTSKLHLSDTGLACALLGVDAGGLAADRPLLGQLLETFVYLELRRQASWNDAPMWFFHFRDRDGAEVDIVVERGARDLAGVEVKAGSTVTPSDFRGLRKLRDAAGRRFVAGVVLYDGEISASFGEGLYAVPVRSLWETR